MTEEPEATSVTCVWCGTVEAEPPTTWTVQTSRRGLEWICEVCTRANVRAMESKLDSEWW